MWSARGGGEGRCEGARGGGSVSWHGILAICLCVASKNGSNENVVEVG